ncbi:selenide, water dikinase SelD [Bacteroidota bacterium]
MKPIAENTISIKTSDTINIKLTHYTQGLGCACKLRPQELESILKKLPDISNDAVLVGIKNADDAAVYRINKSQAIVQTVDFFTPIVDDPYQFGAIAAANALSDIYAMGGKPLFALNIMGFPSKRLPINIMEQIQKGAQDKANEAGIQIIGGHTIEDTEPKYGMAVTGIIHPDKILTNDSAKPFDNIILTKPIGTGIISTAIKKGIASESEISEVVVLMSLLNKTAAEIMDSYPVNACTDVTGFGLIGHLKEMTKASKVNAIIYSKKVPVISSARHHAENQIIPGGTINNHAYIQDVINWHNQISLTEQYLLCDAQTSGGLLISLPEKESIKMLKELHKKGIKYAAIIGKITDPGDGQIFVK